MKEIMNFKTEISSLKLEGHVHSAKITSFLLSITITFRNSAWNLHVRLNVSMLARMFLHAFMGVCVYKDRGLYSLNSNFPKSSRWCLVPKLRLTGFQSSFPDFQIVLLEGHLYNNYFLTSDRLFILFLHALYRH